jgi:hypothetical protein
VKAAEWIGANLIMLGTRGIATAGPVPAETTSDKVIRFLGHFDLQDVTWEKHVLSCDPMWRQDLTGTPDCRRGLTR